MFFEVQINFSAKIYFPFRYLLYKFLLCYSATTISLTYCKIHSLNPHILLRLRFDSYQKFSKALVIIIPFLSFKETNHGYVLTLSITHNKKRILLLNFVINCISVKSAPQISSIKDECTFHFSDFLITGLSNSSVNSWFEIISLLAAPPKGF